MLGQNCIRLKFGLMLVLTFSILVLWFYANAFQHYNKVIGTMDVNVCDISKCVENYDDE